MASFEDCPNDILTNNEVVSYIEPTATEGDMNLTVSCDPLPGSIFEEGVTTVVCNATDAAGNIATDNCNFTVTVGRLKLRN